MDVNNEANEITNEIQVQSINTDTNDSTKRPRRTITLEKKVT